LFQWTGGSFNGAALTNTGWLTITGPGPLQMQWLNNSGTVVDTCPGTLTVVGLINLAGGVFDLQSDGGISSYVGAGVNNAGTMKKSKGAGASTIFCNQGTTFNNTGTVAVYSGTLDIAAYINQVSNNALTAGTWVASGSPTVHSTLDLSYEPWSVSSFTTIGPKAHVTLSGLNSTFSNLSSLSAIAAGGSLSLLNRVSLTTAGALTSSGNITLSPGSILTVNGSFTDSAGTFTIQIGGTSADPTFVQVVSTSGSIVLGSSLKVTSTVIPPLGSKFEILDNAGNSPINGIFAGLAEGSTFTVKVGITTMTFKISYLGSDADGSNNVVITRIL
jgi:hypothetical protein